MLSRRKAAFSDLSFHGAGRSRSGPRPKFIPDLPKSDRAHLVIPLNGNGIREYPMESVDLASKPSAYLLGTESDHHVNRVN
jgi:hypothetical protein